MIVDFLYVFVQSVPGEMSTMPVLSLWILSSETENHGYSARASSRDTGSNMTRMRILEPIKCRRHEKCFVRQLLLGSSHNTESVVQNMEGE